MSTLRERIEAKYVPEPNTGCWLWTASCALNGYGQFNDAGRLWRAHRLLYTLNVGPIPEGMDLDHLCRVRSCVNPDHLEPVTRRVNLLRGVGTVAVNARKTQCKRGHPLDGDNLISNRDGSRWCRECRRANNRALYAKSPRKFIDRVTARRRTLGA